jgi:hypothetical protein
MADRNSFHSSSREKIIELLLIGEMLRQLWQRGQVDVEVLRSDVDSSGYDVVMEHANIVRHIQLKSSFSASTVARQNVSLKLAQKPSGCVVWVVVDRDTLNLGPFLWFGGAPGEALPAIDRFPVAKHTKGNAAGIKGTRPNLRVIGKGQFQKLATLDDLINALFGVVRHSLDPTPDRVA